MRTNTGELIAKPFGLIRGAYALNKTGEVCYRASQVIAPVCLVVWFVFFRSKYSQLISVIFFVLIIIVVFVLSLAALRNGRKLS